MNFSLLNARVRAAIALASVVVAIDGYRAAGARPVALASDPTPLPSGANKTPPAEFRIWAYGNIDTTKGTFLFDKKAGASVLANWTDYGNRLTFDYEHKAVDPNRRAGDGIAAGSALLELREDGLWAVDVRWTPRAASEMAQGEWLYFSPYFISDEKTGRILEIINLALTNVPATKNMQPLVAASRNKPNKDTNMATKKTKADGTAMDGAGDDEAMAKAKAAKLGAAKTRMAKALAELEAAKAECDALSEAALDDGGDGTTTDDDGTTTDDTTDATGKPPVAPPPGADDGDGDATAVPALKGGTVKKMARVIKAAMDATGKTDPDEVVGVLAALAQTRENEAENTKRITALETDLRKARSEKKIAKAMTLGKLTPKMKDYALSIENEKQLDSYLESLPVVAATPANGGQKKADPAIVIDAAKVSLSRIEEQIAQELGIDPTKMREQKARNESRKATYAALAAEDE